MEELAKAISSIAHGDNLAPGGLEGVSIALSGSTFGDGSVAGGLNRIADSIERLAEAIEKLSGE